MTASSPQFDPAGGHAEGAGADRAERLLVAASRQGAPVDQAFLAELRARTTSEFTRAQAREPFTNTRRWQMLIIRALSALTATAALLGSLWVSGVFQGDTESIRWAAEKHPQLAQTAFVASFAKLAEERSFDAEFTTADGAVQRVSGAADGKLRFDTEPGLYSIVDRDRAWVVNEAANRAEPAKADYHYRRETMAAINPWRLLKLEPDEETEQSYREEEQTNGNAPQLVSYFAARYCNEPVAVEAKIDPLQKLPRELMIWPRTNRGPAPLARFHLIQAGGAGDETKFKVAETLTEDGRIGKVIDTQGLVTLRPLATSRWTPVYGQGALLHPRDWLRTDNVGANAVTVQLAPQAKLILGPGTLIELAKPDQLRVHAGVVQVTASDKTPITVTGPDGKQEIIRKQEVWQVADNKLAKLTRDPVWLQGYVGQIPQETLGSLVALVDGRNVNLSVGYHKVTVDIRDQIARTTIEESFVNHTNDVLEGQFYFPLPQDASISGFGMWIGNKLVEADIVEKGRAREIYETILREKRDPGLLEWTGGNIFKARVYPIPGNSEKRIKITYTQVLPLVGDSFRYSYALQSDLLKQNPLRQLELAVTISSTQPIQQVHSPTHSTRNQVPPTAHAARIEFSAQNYTPTRDFEIVTTLAMRSKDLTVIPHVRDDKGYFMLLIQPPNHSGAFTRDVVNDGGPLELLILADTSASLDRASRTRQGEVIGALLAALAPQDKFNLASVDFDCIWTFEKSATANAEDIKKAREILAARRSAGWTNLQRGWESAIAKASPGAHIIYVGDGVITRGTKDLAKDEAAIMTAAKDKNVFGHAIAVSNSFEARTLKAIASVGGGSLRTVAGETKPQQVAHDLLVEATRPALRNIQIRFEGLPTAAVYPETLPNLPASTQQVVLGRYNPKSSEQTGKVTVIGTLDGKPQSFVADVLFPAAAKTGSADDPSFIPRLWARMHLDHLLSQGSSQQTQNDIIAMSEEYHIITPYTSLLVLETDADRERFKVKKRFQMRDGEKFFHEGRKEANYALVQQQIQLAQAWRQQLRQQVLDQLQGLGRDASAIPSAQPFDPLIDLITLTIEPDSWYFNGTSGGLNLNMLGDSRGRQGVTFAGTGMSGEAVWADISGPGSISGFDSDLSLVVEGKRLAEDYSRDSYSTRLYAGLGIDSGAERLGRLSEFDTDYDSLAILSPEPNVDGLWDGPASGEVRWVRNDLDSALARFGDYSEYATDLAFAGQTDGTMLRKSLASYAGRGDYEIANGRYIVLTDGAEVMAGDKFMLHGADTSFGYGLMTESIGFHDRRTRGYGYFARPPTPARQGLLPVPVPYRIRIRPPQKKLEPSWPAEAVALAKSLRLEDDLRALAGGLVIERREDGLAERTGELASRRETKQLFSKSAWLARDDELRDTAPLLAWCDDKVRGNQSLAYDLALTRKSDANDLQVLPSLLNEGGYQAWDDLLPDYEVKLEKQGENRVLLVAKATDLVLGGYEEFRWQIDTERRVVVESERRNQGKTIEKVKYDQFVQAGGRWLATVAEHFNHDGKLTSRTTLKVVDCTLERFQTEWKAALAPRDRAITFELPLPKFEDAEKRVAAGQGTPSDRLVLIARNYARNKSAEAFAELGAAEKLAPKKAGWVWIRLVLQEEFRRHEEVKQVLMQIAEQTTAQRHPAEYAIVGKLRLLSQRLTGGNEQLALFDQLHTAFQRFAAPIDGEKAWAERRLESLSSAGRYDEHREYLAQLAAKYPRDLSLQQQHLSNLRQAGEIAKAFAWIEAALKQNEAAWEQSQKDQLRALHCDMLEAEGRYKDAATYAEAWIEANPDSYDACQRLLAYLLLSGQEAKAFEVATGWLDKHVPAAGQPLKGPALFKVQAAVQLLLGDGRNINRADLDPKHLPRLEKLLLQFAAKEDSNQVALMIWNHGEFRRKDNSGRVIRTLFDRILQGAGTLSIAELRRLSDFVLSHTTTKPDLARWRHVHEVLFDRYSAEKKTTKRTQFRELILQICSYLDEPTKEAALRRFLAEARPREKDQAAMDLFNHWLNQTWSSARETESLAMIERLSSSDDPDERLSIHVTALYRWTDTWEERRRDYLNRQISRPDKMKAEDLNRLHEKNAKQARQEISQRLASAAAARKGKYDAFAKWLSLEHLTLEIRREQNLASVNDQLWHWLQQSLDQKPAAKKPVVDETAGLTGATEEEVDYVKLQLEGAFQQRVLTSLLHLATRKDTQPAHIARLTKLIEDQRQLRVNSKDQPPPNRINWQKLQYDLFVSQDKPKELLAALETYEKLGDPTGHWRKHKARVLAELNQLERAVGVFEELDTKDLLSGADYRSLSVWYHALDEKKKHEATQVKVYRQEQPYRLDQAIRRNLSQWQRSGGPLPEELNPQVLLMFAALLKTEDSPSYYLGTLRQFYEVTHDTRLLHALSQALPGHTAERIYPMLTDTQYVLAQVEHEATIDEVIAGLKAVREQVTTPLDQRAMDLLELMAHRRAAELQNGAVQHIAASVAALERATKRDWLPGERQLMAGYLTSLGKISPPALAAAQMKLLHEIASQAAAGTEESLLITASLAQAEWNYERRDRAIELLTAACNAYRAASNGKVNQTALTHWFQVASWQQAQGRYMAAEQLLTNLLPQVANRALGEQVVRQRYGLYASAIRAGALTSLGDGETLYRAVLAAVQADFEATDSIDRLVDLVEQTLSVFEAGHDSKIASAADELLRYSREVYPPIVARQVNGYEHSVTRMAHAIARVAGLKEGIRFLLDRADTEPSWVKYQGNDAWSRWSRQLADWRKELAGQMKPLGEVEPRLLKFVIAELKRDLRNLNARNRVFYTDDDDYRFWRERANDFAAAAEEVLKEKPNSGTAAMFIADYLFHGLDRQERAAEIVLAAYRQKLLDDGQQMTSIYLLFNAKRHAESIPILGEQMKRYPIDLTRRVYLMEAYHRTRQPQAVSKLLKETDAIFHKENRWAEGAMSQLGRACLTCKLYPQAMEYLKEAIAAHATARMGKPCKYSEVNLAQYFGDAELSSLYRDLALSYNGLKNTKLAVDAAASAIVVWSRRHHQRAEMIETLRKVLSDSPDLAAYVKLLDQETKDSGQDKPVVRKLLGEVFQAKEQYAAAIVQYRAAVQLSPGDAELHKKLIECFDAIEDNAGAIAQSFDSLELDRRNFDLWKQLGERLDKVEAPAEAERARTSLAEVAPGETEGLIELANAREREKRLEDALEQWQTVAEIRKLEPTGLLNMARLQLALKQKAEAAATVKQLDSQSWPERFQEELKKQLPELKKGLK